MSLAILFHFLCSHHVSGINISIFRNLCCWFTTSVVLFSVLSRTTTPTHNELRTRRLMW